MAILNSDKTVMVKNGLIINEYLLTAHNPNKISLPAKRTANQPLIGVTLHNTDWINVAANTTPAEQYVRATVNGNMGDTRVHYYVDDKCAWKDLGDEYTSWHAATGGQGQGNCNTISIECIMRNQNDAVSAASMDNAAKLIAWLFGQYGWTIKKNLYTHNYWTNYKDTGALSADLDAQSLKKCNSKTANPGGKYCPCYILPQWDKFKALVEKHMNENAATVTPTTPAPSSPALTYKVGDIVQFTGGGVYTSSTSAIPAHSRDKSRCKVTQTNNKNKNPYHLISEDGGGVYGWVDAIDISPITAAAPSAQIATGSKVKIKSGAKYYGGGTIPAWVISDTWIVTEVKGDRAVLGKNLSGKNNINSPINTSNLTLV